MAQYQAESNREQQKLEECAVATAVCQHRFEQCNAKVMMLEDEIRALRREKDRSAACEATLLSERARLAQVAPQLEKLYHSTMDLLTQGKTVLDTMLVQASRAVPPEPANPTATPMPKTMGMSSIRNI